LLQNKNTLPTDLTSLDAEIVAEEKARAEAKKHSQSRKCQPIIPINIEIFKSVYSQLLTLDTIRDQMAVFSNLKLSSYEIKENRFILKVSSGTIQKLIEPSRDEIVQFLREKTNNPTIIMEFQIDEEAISEEVRATILTHDDKIRLMEEKNPALLLLQQKFNTFLG
jgi:hypothetical protein